MERTRRFFYLSRKKTEYVLFTAYSGKEYVREETFRTYKKYEKSILKKKISSSAIFPVRRKNNEVFMLYLYRGKTNNLFMRAPWIRFDIETNQPQWEELNALLRYPIPIILATTKYDRNEDIKKEVKRQEREYEKATGIKSYAAISGKTRYQCFLQLPSGKQYLGWISLKDDGSAVWDSEDYGAAARIFTAADILGEKIIDLNKIRSTRVVHNKKGIERLKVIMA